MNAPDFRDEYTDVTPFGRAEPEYVLVRSAKDQHIAWARSRFLSGQIDVDEFERHLSLAHGLATSS